MVKKKQIVSESFDERLRKQQKLVEDEENVVDLPVKLTLKNVNMTLPRGSCTALIGKVGSGKSTLLSALLGELYFTPGTTLRIDRKVAYTSQASWTLSKTIKENILMGLPFDETRFNECLLYSCFGDDLKDMPLREMTMIGNKGVNLSGGQRARLAIARAMYADADVYLFDDPISALDINVGKAVMEKGILSYLKGKTVLVATHALAFLPYFDKIYVLDDGTITHSGTYEELSQDETFKMIYQTLESDHKKGEEDVKRKQDNTIDPPISNQPIPQPLQNLDISHIDIYEVPHREEEAIGTIAKQIAGVLSRLPSMSKLDESSFEKKKKNTLVTQADRDDKIVSEVTNMEDKAQGTVDPRIYKIYIKMMGKGKFIMVFIRRISFTKYYVAGHS